MTNKTAYLALGVAIAALLLAIAPRPPSHETAAPAKQETAFERVMRTNTLRCGYAVFAPYFTKDAASGEFGGIWHDVTEAVADHLGIKVVWAEEVGLGDIGIALQSGKIDAFCAGLWTAGKRVRNVDFLNPSAFEPMFVYVRSDDHRFDSGVSAVNDPGVSISTMDGEGGGLVAQEEFPKAKMVSLPQLSGYADMFNQVVTGKADIVLATPSGVEAFLKNNPGALRPILDRSVRIFPVALAVNYGEASLRDALNQAQQDIIINGTMSKILAKDEPFPGAFLRVAQPYSAPEKQ